MAIYFDFFGIKYRIQEGLSKIKDKTITHNIFGIQDDDSIMCGFYCITFIEYMFAGKTLLDYTYTCLFILSQMLTFFSPRFLDSENY